MLYYFCFNLFYTIMTQKKYIVRLDDACPRMNRKNWERIEIILDRYNIKPIVAVIPDNQSHEFDQWEYDNQFWQKVEGWQEKGWHIALHGYNHIYNSTGKRSLIRINNYSEFAGLPYRTQAAKIEKGLKIFSYHSIYTNIWIAPAHSFDKNTLKALQESGKISIISDGFAFYPFFHHNFLWIPQQCWYFEEKKYGVWTTCIHPNEISENRITETENFIESHPYEFIEDIAQLKEHYGTRRRSLMDQLLEYTFHLKRHYRKLRKLFKEHRRIHIDR